MRGFSWLGTARRQSCRDSFLGLGGRVVHVGDLVGISVFEKALGKALVAISQMLVFNNVM